MVTIPEGATRGAGFIFNIRIEFVTSKKPINVYFVCGQFTCTWVLSNLHKCPGTYIFVFITKYERIKIQ